MNIDELTDDSKNDVLGPHYFTSRDVAEKFIADFQAEHFAPMVKKFADNLYEAGRERFEDFLLADTESNLHSHMWRQIDESVKALLSGEGWALRRYMLADRYDNVKIRAAVAAVVPVELQNARIADLEKELAEVKADNERLRRRDY